MKIEQFRFVLITLLCVSMAACRQAQVEVYSLPATKEGGVVNAVIEISAGTNHKIEFNPETKQFEIDKIDGKDRIIDFLPYPGNYGFIPSTLMDKSQGGDGDALDILVIAEGVPTGTVMEVRPIATLLLNDGGEIDTKLIAVPSDPSKQVMKVVGFEDFITNYGAAQKIIQDWFLSYKGIGKTELIGWQNEIYAMKEIEKWQKHPGK